MQLTAAVTMRSSTTCTTNDGGSGALGCDVKVHLGRTVLSRTQKAPSASSEKSVRISRHFTRENEN